MSIDLMTTLTSTNASYTLTYEGVLRHYPACNERCVGDSHWLGNTDESIHPQSCSSWFASDATTGERVCDCGIATAPPMRLMRVSTDLLSQFGTRTEQGERITAEWGEPDADGIYEPTFTVHHDEPGEDDPNVIDEPVVNEGDTR